MKNIAVIGLFQKTLSEEKQKAFKPATGPIGVLRPLKYVPENSMECLSVSECISKCWTTLKTEGVGPRPSNSGELKQIQWRQKRP